MIFPIIGGTREVEVPASLSLGKGKLYGLTSKAGAPDGTKPTPFGSAASDGRLVMPNTLEVGDPVAFGRKNGGTFAGKLIRLTGDELELDTPEPEAAKPVAQARRGRPPKLATAPKAEGNGAGGPGGGSALHVSTEATFKGGTEGGPLTIQGDKPKAD